MTWPDLCLGLGLGLAWHGLGLAWSRINLGFEKTWITALTTTGKSKEASAVEKNLFAATSFLKKIYAPFPFVVLF